MDTYPGNSSLADEVKRRIVGTYEQSLELAERGRSQEAILGCDFVLELDPQFGPARALKERLSRDGGAPFEAPPEAPPPELRPPAAEEEDLFDLDALDSLELPDVDAPPPAEPAAAGGGLEARFRERLEARDFQGVLDEAAREREAVAASPELQRIAATAQARLEAQPYVEGFLKEAGTAVRAGDLGRVDAILEKARSLDPDHPLLENLEASVQRARGGSEPAPAPPAATGGEAAAEEDDLDLLGGFEIPEPPPGPDTWEREAAGLEPGSDPFSLDLSEGDAAPSLEAPADLGDAPELEAPAGPSAAAVGGAGQAGGDDRISELLAEGQQAADAGDYQGAIDAWSRIFLIDVDHQEAARRIEEARRLKAERERKVEEVFHDGLTALEAGETDRARERFAQVLEMQPGHLAAADYLRQIESGAPVKVARGPSPDETVAMGSLGTFDLSDLGGAQARGRRAGEAADEALREEILVPPPLDEIGSAEASRASTPPGSGQATRASREPGRRSFLLVGGLVLVLVLVAGWWLFVNKDRFFPNSDAEEAPAAAAVAPGPIERATGLHENGQTAMALGVLKRIRPDDPRYGEAQELIARWEAPSAPAAEESTEAVPPEALARRERLLQAAAVAQRQQELLTASALYERAARIAPLDGAVEEDRQAVERQLAPLSEEIELFELGEYDLLLPRLWRRYEEDSSDRDVRRMLVDSYYNRGVRELQRGNAAAAADEFDEALSIAPEDEELQRHFLFAQTYERRNKDLLYRIYVKYLPVR